MFQVVIQEVEVVDHVHHLEVQEQAAVQAFSANAIAVVLEREDELIYYYENNIKHLGFIYLFIFFK